MDRNVKRIQQSFQDRRRAAALEKQKNARRQLTDRARRLALGAADSEDSQEDVQQVKELGRSIEGLPLRARLACRHFSLLPICKPSSLCHACSATGRHAMTKCLWTAALALPLQQTWTCRVPAGEPAAAAGGAGRRQSGSELGSTMPRS
jgi:hypothetical protein